MHDGCNKCSSLELTLIELIETSLPLTMESTTLARSCEVTFLEAGRCQQGNACIEALEHGGAMMCRG